MGVFRLSNYRYSSRVLHKTNGFSTLKPIKPPQGRLSTAPGLKGYRSVGSNRYIRFDRTPVDVVGSEVEPILTIG